MLPVGTGRVIGHTGRIIADPQIERMLGFSLSIGLASSAVFYWTDGMPTDADFHSVGLPDWTMAAYLEDTWRIDPYRLDLMRAENRNIGVISREPHVCEGYRRFLNLFDTSDELTMVLWDDDQPIAILGLFNERTQAPFAVDFNWEALRSHLQDSLRYHPRLRAKRSARRLTTQYGLTKRELDVVRLLASGADNQTIADTFSVSLATVKSHVFNIFNKMGADSRSAAIARTFMLELEYEDRARPLSLRDEAFSAV